LPLDSFVFVAGFDLVQTGDELVEGLSVNDQARNSGSVIGNDVGRSQVIPLKTRINQLLPHKNE
jgi:hypothetical protein